MSEGILLQSASHMPDPSVSEGAVMKVVDESRDDQQRPVMVTGVISDSHTWNLVFLQLFLEERGCSVVNVGPCVPERLLVEECRRHRPALVVVSSVNGHGYQDGMRMIGPLREQFGIAELPVVIGGKLGIRGDQSADERGALIDAGFTAVFDDSAEGLVEFDRVLESLRQSVRA